MLTKGSQHISDISPSYARNGLVLAMLVGCLLFVANDARAQYENVWAFGHKAGIDFNGGTPVPISTSIETEEGTASICDHNGQLLFYTDGTTVYDRNHDTMPNGNILPSGYWALNGRSVTASTHQGAAIVPDPNSRHRYYLFSLQTRTDLFNTGRLSYSVIDMRLNSGLGDVVVGKKDIYLDTLLTEQMTVIPGMDCDAWLVVSEVSDKNISKDAIPYSSRHYRIKAYNVNQQGVAVAPIITDSLPFSPRPSVESSPSCELPGDCMVISFTVSNDWSKLVDNMGRITIYDFDRITGKVSNPVSIQQRRGWRSSCFSPDDNKLYAISSDDGPDRGYRLAQFDILSLNPPIVDPTPIYLNIMHYDTGAVQGIDTLRIGRIKMGPDKKLYFTHNNPLDPYFGRGNGQINTHIGVVNNPNMLGTLSNVQLSAFMLLDSTQAWGSIPNNRIAHPGPKDTLVTRNFSYFDCADTTFLKAGNGWNYRWNDGQTSETRSIDSVGTYVVSYYNTDGYCSIQIDSFFVSDVFSCYNGSSGYAFVERHPADMSQYEFIWMNSGYDTLSNSDTLSGVPAGRYYVWILSSAERTLACFTIDAPAEEVSFDPSDVIVCQGDTINFVNTSSSYYTTFEWQLNADSISTAHDGITLAFPEAGSYAVQLIGTGKVCMDTFSKIILVDSMLSAAFNVEPDEICVGLPVSFYPLLDSSTTGLEWTFSEVGTRVETTLESHYQHTFDRAGRLPITMHAQFRACPDTSYTDSITVYPFPEVDLGDDDAICLHGKPVFLKNLREAPLIPYQQVWSTGDTTEILKVVHPGTYTLSVTTEPLGCTNTESIVIRKDCFIDIPNAFTPNGDGHNDFFFPRRLLSESINRFDMQVFNRWGQLVFETKSPDGRGWDGRFNDQDQPVGVYLYRIEVDFGENRKLEQYEGNVTLIR